MRNSAVILIGTSGNAPVAYSFRSRYGCEASIGLSPRTWVLCSSIECVHDYIRRLVNKTLNQIYKSYRMVQNSFITNKDKLLSDIMNGILPKSQSLDVLVGYFYFSGYKLISEMLMDKPVRILVGLDIDTFITKYVREIDTLADYNMSRSQLKDDYYARFVKLFNETDLLDSQPKLESFKLFYNKIKAGTLEIRKTDEPCHAKMYIFDYKDEIN